MSRLVRLPVVAELSTVAGTESTPANNNTDRQVAFSSTSTQPTDPTPAKRRFVPPRYDPRARVKAPRHSPEVVRDSKIEVEPIDCTEAERLQFVEYRRVRTLIGSWVPEPGVPATRAQCPPDRAESGCSRIECRLHLWRAPRAGRPGLKHVPRDSTGHTASFCGILGERDVDAIIPRWLEPGPMPMSCALDVAELGPRSNEQIGAVTGRHRTLVALEIKRALRSLIAKSVTANDLRELAEQSERDRES